MSVRRGLPIVGLALAGGLALLVWLAARPAAGPARAPAPDLAPVLPSAPPGQAGQGRDEPATPAIEVPARPEEGALEVLVNARGVPTAGAAVRLYVRRPVEPGTGLPGWRLAGTGTTGAAGNLRLAAPPGAYLVSARLAGFAAGQREVVRPSGEPLTRAEIRLEPGASLRGRVVARGVRGAREPVPLAGLVLFRELSERRTGPRVDPPPEERVVASADATGRFGVDGLAPGSWTLDAQAPGFARSRMTGLEVPHAGELLVELAPAGVLEGYVLGRDGAPAPGAEVSISGRDEVVTATAGPSGGFSAEVRPGSFMVSARRGREAGALSSPVVVASGPTRGVVIRLGESSAIAGAVVAASGGAPVTGASVGLSPAGRGGEFARALTGSDGAFLFEGLAPGAYDLDVTADGFTPLVRGGLTLLGGERFAVRLELGGTGAVAGQVADPAGRPIQGAIVRGGRRWGGGFGSVDAEARTDAAGGYRIVGLELGRAVVTARREGSVLGVSRIVDILDGETARADLVLEGSGWLEGSVRRRGGLAPGAAAVVLVRPREGGHASGRERAPVPVDPSGLYRLELPAGDYAAIATTESGPRRGEWSPATVEAGRATRLDLEYDDAPERDQQQVSVLVLEPGGTPSPGATVLISAGGARDRGLAIGFTDGEGRASVRVPEDREAFWARARNGGRTSPPAQIRVGGEAILTLQPGGAVRGRVLSADGTRVDGFTLEVRLPAEDRLGWQEEGRREHAGDRFELWDVPAGGVVLAALTREGLVGESEVTAEAGAVVETSLVLQAGAAVAGRAVDPLSGEPVAGAVLWVDDRHGSSRSVSGADGRFGLASLPAGRRQVRLRAPGRQPVERDVTLAAGKTVELGDVPLPPAPARSPAR